MGKVLNLTAFVCALFLAAITVVVCQHTFLIDSEEDSESLSSEEIPSTMTTRRDLIGKHEMRRNLNIPLQAGDQSEQWPEVETKNGVLRGKTVVTKNYRNAQVKEKEVVAFLGIPFAKPPIGGLRFRRPVPLGKWNGVRDATTLPNSCPQVLADTNPGFRGEMQWNANTNISEDCLYLNIWIPGSIFRNIRNPFSALSSIIFWIHGGGYHSGTSTLDIYDGATFAAENEIIVVSTQYRLGALGFLYFGTDDAPGNMGLLDQHLAMQWVSDNIKAFGGNPDEVTLMGESAGGACATHHLLSPLSRSLFKRAIAMSGDAGSSWGHRSKTEAWDTSYKIAKDAGCCQDEYYAGQDISSVLACLRKVDPDTILTAQHTNPPKNFEGFPMYPTIDDYFLPDDPQVLLRNWDTRRADLMMGTTENEGSYFTVYAYPKYFNKETRTPVSYDGFMTTLMDIFHDRPTFELDAIVTQYTNWVNPEDGFENHDRLAKVIGDAFFTCPAQDFMRKWATRGSNVWYYYFNARSEQSPWGEWMGAIHADDIEFAFGVPLRRPDAPKREMDISSNFMAMLSKFAKNGNPSDDWAKYKPLNPVHLEINNSIITGTSKAGDAGPRAMECAFWNHYLPKLRRMMHNVTQCK